MQYLIENNFCQSEFNDPENLCNDYNDIIYWLEDDTKSNNIEIVNKILHYKTSDIKF
jgi:hypothetical protein